MNVEIKWENIDGQKAFNDKLIDLAKKYAKSEDLTDFKFHVLLEPNSRHIINLLINTKKDNQTIDVSSNSYNLDNSFYLLNKELKRKIREYDPNATEKALLKQEKINERIRINREKAIENEKKRLEEQELKAKEKLSAHERETQKKLQKQNEEILKKLEKNRKEDEKEDEKIINELEEQKKQLEEARRIEQENQEKLEKHMETLKFDVIQDDLTEDHEIQEKIKEDKKKLRDLQSEENECLVIIEEIKELDKQQYDPDLYQINVPFQLADYWFYFDQNNNYYIATDEGTWAPIDYNEFLNYYESSKYVKFQELELRLIDARKRRKLHLKDLVDGQELIKELEESKYRHKKLEKQQQENFKKLKEDYENTAKQSNEELKAHIKPVDIDIAEIHPANEPFLTEYNAYAYHDGEGNYFIADEYNNWVPVSKADVYSKSKLIESEHKFEHQAGDQFQNLKGDYFYFDGETYYKYENENWIPCTVAEALDLDERKKHEEKNKKKEKNQTQALNNQSTSNNEQSYQSTQTTNNNEQIVDYNNAYNAQQDASIQNLQVDENGGQQWTDENGTTWYLDAAGNYFWWDGNEWVAYSYQ